MLRFILLLMVFATPACAADWPMLNRQVDSVVITIKGKDPDAVEYRKARTIHLVDIDGDGIQDAIVFFTVEGRDGGNNYEMYLTVLKGQPSGFLLLDTALIGGGGLGAASFERPAVENGRIVIQRAEYGDDDSRCCPSKRSSVVFILRGSKLVDVTSKRREQ